VACQRHYASPVPDLTLTDEELRDAAQAARMAAHRAQQDAAAQPNPRISAAFAAAAELYTQLAQKFEGVRHESGGAEKTV
jgi:hypothetical protein